MVEPAQGAGEKPAGESAVLFPWEDWGGGLVQGDAAGLAGQPTGGVSWARDAAQGRVLVQQERVLGQTHSTNPSSPESSSTEVFLHVAAITFQAQ